MRALAERTLPRDLYDVVNIFRREDLRGAPHSVRGVLTQKCQHRGIGVPALADIEASPRRGELESEWENMLGHQLPELPPVSEYLTGLAELFEWLEERAVAPAPLPAFPDVAHASERVSMPPALSSWPGGVPLEQVRFAAMNRLCVDLRYDGTVRRIEPYSLRQSSEGNRLLYAVRRADGAPRSYRVDRIQGVALTRESFTPRYPIEFSPSTSLSYPPPVSRRRESPVARPARRRGSTGPRYVVQCAYCGKRFTRKNTALSAHKAQGSGYPCPGKTGYVVGPAN